MGGVIKEMNILVIILGLTKEELAAKETEEFDGVYCKVNVKTGKVTRISQETGVTI